MAKKNAYRICFLVTSKYPFLLVFTNANWIRGKGNICKNLIRWKNYALWCFSCHKKNCKLSTKKQKKYVKQFFIRLMWCFWFLDYLQLFNHIWKTSGGIIFSMCTFFAYVPPPTINDNQLRLFHQKFICKTCRIGKIIIYIWSTNVIIIDLWRT